MHRVKNLASLGVSPLANRWAHSRIKWVDRGDVHQKGKAGQEMKDALNQESCISWRVPTFLDLRSSNQSYWNLLEYEIYTGLADSSKRKGLTGERLCDGVGRTRTKCNSSYSCLWAIEHPAIITSTDRTRNWWVKLCRHLPSAPPSRRRWTPLSNLLGSFFCRHIFPDILLILNIQLLIHLAGNKPVSLLLQTLQVVYI